ncbi:MAG: hypothetical protein M3Y59_00150 [Myxococcota bacterium]|nr:hypothetical protein [Myxococcota bacterium]
MGGDLRLAGLLKDTGSSEGVQRAVFPMQADLSLRAGPEWLSATVVVGLRGVARAEERQPDSELPPPPLPVLSREHSLSSTLPGTPVTLRAGRFFAPYGLRLADHTAYVRRFLDQHLEQEPYGLSVSAVEEDWEVHGTAFVRDPLRTGGPGQWAGRRWASCGWAARPPWDSPVGPASVPPAGG